jgi:hypothetical protein
MHSRALVMTDLVSDLLNIAPRDKAEILARALPYIRRFHAKTMHAMTVKSQIACFKSTFRSAPARAQA